MIGDTGPFERDWWAPGWKDEFPDDEVAIPTALTFRRNVGPEGGHIDDPELRAAEYLSQGPPPAGDRRQEAGREWVRPDGPRVKIATIDSAPIVDILRRMNTDSVNFAPRCWARSSAPRSRGWARSLPAPPPSTRSRQPTAPRDSITATRRGCRTRTAYHVPGHRAVCSGASDRQPWASDLRFALPIGGQGTLEGRLGHTRVRAKTGTLTDVSALSGWVWSEKVKDWVEFSILSDGLSKDEAIRIEDAIVPLVSARAKAPAHMKFARVELRDLLGRGRRRTRADGAAPPAGDASCPVEIADGPHAVAQPILPR